MTNIRLISLKACWILVIIFVLSVLSFAGLQSQINTEAEQHYEKANELYKLADCNAAITEFEQVIKLAPKSAIAQNAKYWIGQLYFETKQFDTALKTFQELINEFPDSIVVSTTKTMIERVQQAKKNRALFEAVKKADFEQVKQLIAGGANIDAKWSDTSTKEEQEKTKKRDADNTPLCCAVDSNNMDIVKLLVEAGADINVDAKGWTPLCRAVDESKTAIVEYLIDHGAKVNYPADYGPLQYVINNIEMVKLLIARGADVNYSRGGWPAIMQTIYDERVDIMELLIRNGADVNITDKKGYSPLYHAVIMYDPKKPKIYMEMVKLLIANGADVNYKNRRGETALWLAAGYDTELVQFLLEAGADINTKDNSGRTALHNAALGYNDVVELLLTKGADINAKDTQNGYTALHLAARFGNTDAIKVLIDRDADINAKDKEGHTPLYIAVNNNYKAAEMLIEKGADSSIKTESGKTLLELAQQRKKAESPVIPDMIFDGEPNSYFGSKIVCGDIDGDGYDDILIGAYQYGNKKGRVYLFYGGPGMDNKPDLIFEGQNDGDWFGNGIVCGDIDNDGHDDIIIAAGCYNERRGCAYLYWGSDRSSMDAKPDKIFTGEAEKHSEFGAGQPAIYDIDNDGYSDIILGAIRGNNGTGRAYLYYGNTKELMDTSYGLILTGENQGDFFGYNISCGDVDNDNYGDIVIGDSRATDGKVYLYYGGSKASMDAKADVIFKGKSEDNDYFGESIVCFDQNRDGFDDIVIGARSSGKLGRAFLFHGNSKNDMGTNPDIIFEGEIERSLYGDSVIYGDIDGDNVNDIVIAEPGWGMGVPIVGRVNVYWGNELTGPDPRPGKIIIDTDSSKDPFGNGLACGDINNDGFDDIVVGVPRYKSLANQGRVYLYYGGPRK